jgi:hypothetical protein
MSVVFSAHSSTVITPFSNSSSKRLFALEALSLTASYAAFAET